MPFDHALAESLSPVAEAMPLSRSAKGERVRIVAVCGGGGLERRLTELGLHRGSELAVIGRMGRKGPVIVGAHGTRLVVGAEMAEAISVAPLGA